MAKKQKIVSVNIPDDFMATLNKFDKCVAEASSTKILSWERSKQIRNAMEAYIPTMIKQIEIAKRIVRESTEDDG